MTSAVRSMVDPITYVRFIHINTASLPDDRLEQYLRMSDAEFRTYFHEDHHRFININVDTHETIHYWQGVTFPYMHWYALNSFQIIANTISRLSQLSTNVKDWSCLIPSLLNISLPQGFSITVGGISNRPRYEVEFKISSMELLECATSLLQWQITYEGNPLDSKQYRRWLKRNPSYHRAYDIVCRVAQDESLAIRLFAALVSTAFRTNNPPLAFAKLLSYVNVGNPFFRSFIAQPEPCKWKDLFNLILCEEINVPNGDINDFENPSFGVIDNALGMTIGAVPHPILTPDTKDWMARSSQIVGLENFLYQPRFASREISTAIFQNYMPPYTIVRLHAGKMSRNIHIARQNRIPASSPEDFGRQVHTLLVFAGLAKAAAGMATGDRLCHHAKCPYYDDNYCSGYSIAPPDYHGCKFPVFTDDMITSMRKHAQQRELLLSLPEGVRWQRLKSFVSNLARGRRPMN